MSEDRVYDDGLALERTALAWQRTALAFAVAAVAAAQLFLPAGLPAVVLAFAGAACAIATLMVATMRYRAVHRHLHRTGRHPGPGVAVAGLTASVVLLGVACLAYALGR
ncbi:DUF202 domain-containing protein [Demequina sp. SYSU T00192]|uniref:DUF202 domain-containing protein n=1 Tax=Demequina litoralis TaxID=3051660 RepID=A0ABT8G6T9_9MICO|nr:DUF202 domain-containing protein [Demequina sp. SYSU T00192]MDN4474868.1 DUF202 domain-containing protein [Demequina sp. SYSU T00192]